MAQVTVPIDDTFKNFSFSIALDGETFFLAFRWSVRDEAFFITVSDSTKDPIVSNRRLVADQFILRGISDPRKPLGELFLLDTQSLGRGPQLGELGSDFEMIYLN